MIKSTITGPLITLFLVIFLVPASHAQMMQSDNAAVPYKSITPQVERTIDNTAIFALRQISLARSSIHRNDIVNAQMELAEAERLIETIKNDLSTAVVKNLIRIAHTHLEYEPAKQVLKDLPRIYASLEKISDYLPTDKTKRYVDLARNFLKNNDTQNAGTELVRAEKTLIVIEVEQPLFGLERYVKNARVYLDARNFNKADQALQKAELRALDVYSSLNSPLFQAKQNIWLALRSLPSAKHSEVGTRLQKARSYLDTASEGGSSLMKAEAGKLSQELTGLEKKLTRGGKVAESDLKAAWEKSAALTERSVAYLTAGLSEAETTLKPDSDLIEARLHVAYAETYQVTTGEPLKAVMEIEQAMSYLKKAEVNTLSDATDRKKIHEIGNILVMLKLTPSMKDNTVRDRYDTVKEELRNLNKDEGMANVIQEVR